MERLYFCGLNVRQRMTSGIVLQVGVLYICPKKITVSLNKNGFLGRGGFGVVRLGRMESLSEVAIKFVRFTGSDLQIDTSKKK